ncbi:IS200/IS605 family accessory protein TnpB-related protein [Virgibacillus sp. NKC19-16]|uniref:IS200/IS605 family accessory protein TnpB-related protein n=1 Tax=Virgibacillus salidurans TaxID=2831673 RepID=UPI001F1D8D87|nr:IS200/IS605 family accessory protein TnpB-related protein [Virgibacillus sp. NKC19-16]UJL45442.1 IS200/IS605 family accessory protein TnpB-related protein [Virgibacillus sp. NKC19-16]
MTIKTYFSNRIYKNTLNSSVVEDTQHTLFTFNQAKHFRVQEEVRQKRGSKVKSKQSVHLSVKAKYALNDYYTNSVVQEGKALLSSQEELTKMYISNKKEQIKSVKKKIKNTKSNLTVLKKIKGSFIKGTPKFNKISREQQKGNFFVVEYKNKTDIYYNSYDFEHLYIDVKIKQLISLLGRLRFRLDRLQKQISSLRSNTKSVCFGSNKLAKARTTTQKYQTNRELWKQDWYLARYGKMTISGRKDAKAGNFVFIYDPDNNALSFKAINGIVVKFDNIVFPYGQENVDNAVRMQMNLKNKKAFGKPIGWSIEDCGEYYIAKALVDVQPNPYVNHSKDSGIIGLDLNVDHFAVSNTNAIGQLIESFSIKFDIHNKTTGQLKKIIEAEAIDFVDYAAQHKKPVALEKLDTTKSKVKNPYGNKKANRLMSQFAYNIMIIAIKSRADKMGVEVYEVNPAYTSQIGKMKYMKRLGISIHEAASYVIARRAMGFKEKLPPVLHSLVPEKKQGLHHWAQWAYISNSLSNIRKNTFYQIELSRLNGLCSWDTLFSQDALTDFEKTGLSKLESRKSKA